MVTHAGIIHCDRRANKDTASMMTIIYEFMHWDLYAMCKAAAAGIFSTSIIAYT